METRKRFLPFGLHLTQRAARFSLSTTRVGCHSDPSRFQTYLHKNMVKMLISADHVWVKKKLLTPKLELKLYMLELSLRESKFLDNTGTHEFRSWDEVTILFVLLLQSIPEINWSCCDKSNKMIRIYWEESLKKEILVVPI